MVRESARCGQVREKIGIDPQEASAMRRFTDQQGPGHWQSAGLHSSRWQHSLSLIADSSRRASEFAGGTQRKPWVLPPAPAPTENDVSACVVELHA